jgi:hypothetical protein
MNSDYRVIKIVLTLAFTLLVPEISTAASGTITTAVWHVEDSPVHVTGNITIPAGNTLTIEPGVDVLFDSLHAAIIVEGELLAFGTPSDSIRFIPGTAAEWGSLRFNTSDATDTSRIEYARLSGSRATYSGLGGAISVSVANARVELSNCVIMDNVAGQFGGGVFVEGGSVSLDRCIVARNMCDRSLSSAAGGALYASNSATVDITSSTFYGNQARNEDGSLSVIYMVVSSLSFLAPR